MKNILIGFFAAIAIVSVMAQVTQPSVPVGAVFHFTTGTCPSGYTEHTASRGRVIVGLVAAGTNAASVGTALTDQENRPSGQHTHTVTVTVGNVLGWDPTAGDKDTGGGTAGQHQASTLSAATSNPAGSVAGTNAPYYQLITCQKQ